MLGGELDMSWEPSEEARREALMHPNGWLYMIDGNYGPSEFVPPEAIVGAWKVNEKGLIVGDFMPNSNYVKRDCRSSGGGAPSWRAATSGTTSAQSTAKDEADSTGGQKGK